jgi:hypothetical protein
MITFNRSQIVGAEFLSPEIICFNGIQEDHIYGMEISMEVGLAQGTILKIHGNMKRYTNFVCPSAVPVLQVAVGMSLYESGWDKIIMKEIGRKGCEHFAEIIIECGRCLDQAVMARDLASAIKKDSDLDQKKYLDSWVPTHKGEKPCA